MKKRLVTYLFVVVMAFSVAIPVMAAEVVEAETKYTMTEQEIAPRTEMTRIYWRNHNGQVQFRVWSITNGRWLTDWTNAV